MKKSITKLSDSEEKKLKDDFLKSLGNRLKMKRIKTGLSQKEMGYCVSVDDSTISKYEKGERDMNVSNLPLYSLYCDFPIYELFPKEQSKELFDTFSSAVSITIERMERKKQLEMARKHFETLDKSRKTLKAEIYEVDGKEEIIPVEPKEDTQGKLSERDKYRYAEIIPDQEPFDEKEYYEYIQGVMPSEIMESIKDAGSFLQHIKDVAQKNTIKGAIADFVVDEFVINRVMKKDAGIPALRAYSYYYHFYHNTLKPDGADTTDEKMDDLYTDKDYPERKEDL